MTAPAIPIVRGKLSRAQLALFTRITAAMAKFVSIHSSTTDFTDALEEIGEAIREHDELGDKLLDLAKKYVEDSICICRFIEAGMCQLECLHCTAAKLIKKSEEPV